MSKISWCDSSITPQTGCLHSCPYCYASILTRRYADRWHVNKDFKPEFHPDRVVSWYKYRKHVVFANSMGDLWGDWVPAVNIYAVLKAALVIENAVLFLTKNPKRYAEILGKLDEVDVKRNWWWGVTLDLGYEGGLAPTLIKRVTAMTSFKQSNKWISFEPFDPICHSLKGLILEIQPLWVVIGTETNYKYHATPDTARLWDMIDAARSAGAAVFVKDRIFEQSNEQGWPREFPEGIKLYTKSNGWKPKLNKGSGMNLLGDKGTLMVRLEARNANDNVPCKAK